MDVKSKRHSWLHLLICLALLLPAVLLFLLPSGGFIIGAHWLWILLMICFWFMLLAIGAPDETPPAMPMQPARRMLYPDEQPAPVREVMDVEVATAEAGTLLFRGHLRQPADRAFETLKRELPEYPTPLIQEDEAGGAIILLAPSSLLPKPPEPEVRPWVHWLLFLLTVMTTTAAGAAHQGVNLWREPNRFAVGLPYALGLMAILGVHELGHYFVAKRHGIRVTPPYFIPVPFALGTFGAFIQMRSMPENRRALFDVAVAGTLAGLAIAIPALLIAYIHPRSFRRMPPPCRFMEAALRSALRFCLRFWANCRLATRSLMVTSCNSVRSRLPAGLGCSSPR